jgi:hypothetical protein
MGGCGLIHLGQDREQVAGCAECGNETSGSTKCWEFIE